VGSAVNLYWEGEGRELGSSGAGRWEGHGRDPNSDHTAWPGRSRAIVTVSAAHHLPTTVHQKPDEGAFAATGLPARALLMGRWRAVSNTNRDRWRSATWEGRGRNRGRWEGPWRSAGKLAGGSGVVGTPRRRALGRPGAGSGKVGPDTREGSGRSSGRCRALAGKVEGGDQDQNRPCRFKSIGLFRPSSS